jgi:hypothetical protein
MIILLLVKNSDLRPNSQYILVRVIHIGTHYIITAVSGAELNYHAYRENNHVSNQEAGG